MKKVTAARARHHGPPFEVSGQPLHDVRVTLPVASRSLLVTCTMQQDRAAADAPVMIFSVSPQFWIRGGRRVQVIRTDASGQFSVRGLPAGSLSRDRLEDARGERPGRPTDLEPYRAGATPVELPAPRRTPPCTSDWPRSPLRPAVKYAMVWLSIAGGVFLVWLVLVFLFTPAITITCRSRTSVSADDFLYTIQSTCQAALHHGNRVTILTDGPTFYAAMLEAIRGATRSVNMECYIFQPGRVGRAVHRGAERAGAQRRQRDASSSTRSAASACGDGRWRVCARRAAGFSRTRRVRWYSLHRINNRTHRELLIVDGSTAFVGRRRRRGLVGVPAEESSTPVARHDGAHRGAGRRGAAGRGRRELAGMLRRDPDRAGLLSRPDPRGDTTAFVVKSSPSDRATASRVTFQLLIEGADRAVRICTPYFLPDRALRRALVEHGRGAASRSR